MSEDPFGFRAAAQKTAGELDIELFAPRPRVTDQDAARAAREVAKDAGFTRRASVPAAPPEPIPAPPAKPDPASIPQKDPILEAWFASERVPASGPGMERPAKPARSPKRRVNIADLLGIQDRYPTAERAQLNMLAPVPVVLRWRKLVADRQLPAWETLEAAMNALEVRSRVSRGLPED